MSENSNVLIAEVDRVVKDSRRYLAEAEELVEGIPRRRARVEERIAAAQERSKEAREEWYRVREDDDVGWAEQEEVYHEYLRASSAVSGVRSLLGSDDLDSENRKAVARQVASLVREDADQRLRAIAARSDNPEVRRVVAECKEQVASATYHLMRGFAEARSLEHEEVRTTRAEAYGIFERLKNPPADQ